MRSRTSHTDAGRRPFRRRRTLRLWPLGFALFAIACRQTAPPNIVVVTVDTLRADHLTPYGYTKIETPAIARLAAEGIVYERAFADTSWTLPSLCSVMTGKYPSDHRVRNWSDTLNEREETVAELLKKRGYKTAAIVGSYPLDRYFGLAQGFDDYDDTMTQSLFAAEEAPDAPAAEQPERPVDDSDRARAVWQMSREKNNAFRTDREVADAAIAWLDGNTQSPVFLWVHFFGPHEKGKRMELDAPARKAHVDAQIARYDPDIEEMDRQVGRLLERIGTTPDFANTAIIFHSDHGQSLQEHGLFGHGLDLYDTSVHVPLIVRLPGGRRAGQRVDHLVRNLDIFATVAALAGAAAPRIASRSLLDAPDSQNHTYLESHHLLGLTAHDVEVGEGRRKVGMVLRGIRTDHEKLIIHQPFLAASEDGTEPLSKEFVSQQTESYLFDVETDPQEHRNLAPKNASKLEELRTDLSEYDDGSHSRAVGNDLDEAARERLRSLGYQPE